MTNGRGDLVGKATRFMAKKAHRSGANKAAVAQSDKDSRQAVKPKRKEKVAAGSFQAAAEGPVGVRKVPSFRGKHELGLHAAGTLHDGGDPPREQDRPQHREELENRQLGAAGQLDRHLAQKLRPLRLQKGPKHSKKLTHV